MQIIEDKLALTDDGAVYLGETPDGGYLSVSLEGLQAWVEAYPDLPPEDRRRQHVDRLISDGAISL